VSGKDLSEAKKYLTAVLERTRCIPFRRFCGGVGRTAQAKNENSSTGQGRWPVKSVEFIMGLLKNAESNAEARARLRSAAAARTLPQPPAWHARSRVAPCCARAAWRRSCAGGRRCTGRQP
jgi:hypothetical protein